LLGILERLDRVPAVRWARLRDGVPRLRLLVIVPRAYLEIVNTRPTTWTMVVEERYAVCPNCAHRVAVGLTREPMSCGRCDGVFGFELHSMEEIELRHEASWRRETP
jgi:hypothetical protein